MSDRRVAIVSGGNKGIGFGIVKLLCDPINGFSGDVVLTARDETRGRDAVKQLNHLGLKPLFHQMDIDDNDSIDRLKQYLADNYDGVDVIVNNAAIAYSYNSTVPFVEQAQNTLKTNFFATRNVCSKLFPILKSHARVVNVSSSAGMLKNMPSISNYLILIIDLLQTLGNALKNLLMHSIFKGESLRRKFCSPDLTDEELVNLVETYLNDVRNDVHIANGWPKTAYSMSKIALNALTFIQQKQLNEDKTREDIIVNAVHPGYVDTDMSNHKGPLTIEQGADAPTYLALLPKYSKQPIGDMVWCDRTIVKWDAI